MTHRLRTFDGFESQNLLLTDGTFGTISALQAIHGQYSLRWAPAGGAPKTYVCVYHEPDGTLVSGACRNFLWVEFHLYLDTLPAGGQYGMICQTSNFVGNVSGARVDQNGKIEVYGNVGGWSAASANALATGRWYCFSFKHFNNINAQVIVRDMAGAEVVNITSAVNADNTNFFGFGGNGTGFNSYGIWYYDNFVAENDTTAAAIDDPYLLLGAYYGEVFMKSTGNGTDNSGWTGTWTDVDEAPKNDDVDYRDIGYVVGAFTNTHEDPDAKAYYPILAVHDLMVHTWVKRISSPAGWAVYTRLRRGPTVAESTSGLVGVTVYQPHAFTWLVDPTDGLPWTATRVKTVEMGLRNDNTIVGENGRCTSAYLSILVTFNMGYVPGQRLLHYTLDVNDPDLSFTDQVGRAVPPEELRPNRWQAVVGWRPPSMAVITDYVNDPEKVPIISVRFTEPDRVSLGSGADDLLGVVLSRLTERPTT